MNITDLIVEFIQQGNVVEFPGMGTLTSSNVNAYHDAATSIYYPARRTVVMTETLAGNKAVVRRIAERECVTNEIAEQMWANYVSALKDKLQHNPKGHEFPGIGCLRLSGSKVVFDALEGLDLDAGKKHEQPLENVATYTPKEVEDPFAAFEKPATPKPPVVEEPKPEPVVEPVKVTPVAAPAAPAPEPEVVAAPIMAAAAQSDHLSEVKRKLDEIPSSPKSAKEMRRAEKAAAKAEKEARKAAEEAEKARAREKEEARKAAEENAKALAKEREKNALKAEKEKEKAERAALKQQKAEKKEKKEKKKRRTGLWLLLLLLLLLIAGAVYYFTQVYHPAPKGESCAQDVTLSYRDQFTDDYALLKFEEMDIRKNAGLLHDFMADYVKAFLMGRHYGNAFAAVMNQVDQYADGRLHELMVEGYCVKRFFPYEDFWLERNYGEYKDAGAHYYRCMVQKELMDYDLLDGILDDVVMNLGLHADGYGYGYGADGAAGGRGRGAAAKPVSDRPYEEVVPEAPTFKDSKQGFDIIAGFFTSKKSANKCANQLKALGSDAYIISKSGGYYVSMGSAPTRTAAEAMEKHIKSWYKSDVKIYNFNE